MDLAEESLPIDPEPEDSEKVSLPPAQPATHNPFAVLSDLEFTDHDSDLEEAAS